MAAASDQMSVPNIDELFQPTHDERARQSFVSMLRKHAWIDMRRAMAVARGRLALPEMSFGSVMAGMSGPVTRGPGGQHWRGFGVLHRPYHPDRVPANIRLCYGRPDVE